MTSLFNTKLIQLILSIIPKFYWLILILSCGLEYVFQVNFPLTLSINLIFFVVILKICIAIHEVGHILFAKLLGGEPKSIILGSGKEIFRFKIKKIEITINSKLNIGFSMVIFNKKKLLKLRQLFYYSGGIIINLTLIFIIYRFFSFNINNFLTRANISTISDYFIFSNLVLVILNLPPYKIKYKDTKISSDGLAIIKLIIKRNY